MAFFISQTLGGKNSLADLKAMRTTARSLENFWMKYSKSGCIHWIANCIHLLYVEGAPLNCSQIPKECRGVRIVLRMNEVGTLVKDFMCMKSQGTITLWHVCGFYKRLAHINNNSQLESKSCCLLWVLWELLVFSCAILILKSFNIWTSIWWIIST